MAIRYISRTLVFVYHFELNHDNGFDYFHVEWEMLTRNDATWYRIIVKKWDQEAFKKDENTTSKYDIIGDIEETGIEQPTPQASEDHLKKRLESITPKLKP